MRKLIFLFCLWAFPVLAQTTTYTEFFCNSTGTNVNSGSTTNAAATYTSANGNWDGTSVFTPTDGSTPASSINVGDWASVCLDAATNSVFISRIVTVAAGANGAITVSTTAISGTAPASGATGRTLRVGGAWKGAYGSVLFPFAFAANTMTNVTGNPVRVNIWAGYSNLVTASINHSLNGPIVFEGYTSIPGDGGKAIIDGSGGSIVPINFSGFGISAIDIISQHATGNFDAGFRMSGGNLAIGCVSRNITGASSSGFNFAGACVAIECEGYGCNNAGINLSSGATVCNRCYAHNNGGDGFTTSVAGVTLIRCLSVSNSISGFKFTSTGSTSPNSLINCDAYGNVLQGLELSALTTSPIYVENCNFINNTAYGIDCFTNSLHIGFLANNYFGTGTAANGSGSLSPNIGTTNGMLISNFKTYSSNVTPYVSAPTNFTLTTSAASYGGGRGIFTDLRNSGGTVSYPSVGAASVTNAASSGGQTSHTFIQ